MSRLTTKACAAVLAAEYGRAIEQDYNVAHQRFGQWVCNNYLRPGVVWSELFYKTNTDAFRLIDEEQFG